MITAGDQASLTREITEESIAIFAQASGDNNPIHVDAAYASQSSFGRRIAHGMLTASLISAVISSELPGPGSLYLKQTLQFKQPVYIGDMITATVEVVKYHDRRRLATLHTTCVNQHGVVVLTGEALVQLPDEQA